MDRDKERSRIALRIAHVWLAVLTGCVVGAMLSVMGWIIATAFGQSGSMGMLIVLLILLVAGTIWSLGVVARG